MRLSEVSLIRRCLILQRRKPVRRVAEIMSILTRRLGDALLVGDNVTITLVNVDGNKVRIGIDAPEDVLVLRKELVKKVEKDMT